MLCPSKLSSRDACTFAYSWNFDASFPRSCSCSLCREPRRRGTVACDVFYKRTVLQLPARPLFFFKVTATPQFAASFERLKLHAIHRINQSLESFILGNLTHTMHRTQKLTTKIPILHCSGYELLFRISQSDILLRVTFQTIPSIFFPKNIRCELSILKFFTYNSVIFTILLQKNSRINGSINSKTLIFQLQRSSSLVSLCSFHENIVGIENSKMPASLIHSICLILQIPFGRSRFGFSCCSVCAETFIDVTKVWPEEMKASHSLLIKFLSWSQHMSL